MLIVVYLPLGIDTLSAGEGVYLCHWIAYTLRGWRGRAEEKGRAEESDSVWSVARTGYQLAADGEDPEENEVNGGYVASVQTFNSKDRAIQYARNNGPAYVVKDTQMWNEPLGQIEESNRESSFVKFYR